MIGLAHIGGVPFEELIPIAAGAGEQAFRDTSGRLVPLLVLLDKLGVEFLESLEAANGETTSDT